jgi:hypothetical protein
MTDLPCEAKRRSKGGRNALPSLYLDTTLAELRRDVLVDPGPNGLHGMLGRIGAAARRVELQF